MTQLSNVIFQRLLRTMQKGVSPKLPAAPKPLPAV
jgi:hypothetical protein